MTEEIIIDGVDVAGCEYLNKVVNEEPYCNIDEEHLYTCSSDENCYFKQLKHLEQENFELKSDVLKWQKAFSRQYQINENKGYSKAEENYRSALEEINRVVKLAHKVEDYLLGQDYTDLVDRIENKINEVLQ